MQQQDEPFPLAAALGFDAPAAHQPADGQPADEQPAAPMAWVELFCTVHADPAIFTGILRTCRGGRDWALSRVSRLSLIFRAADCKSAKVFQARVRAAKRAIQARREEQLAAWRPVGLRINCDYGSLHPMLRTLPDALRDQGTHARTSAITHCTEQPVRTAARAAEAWQPCGSTLYMLCDAPEHRRIPAVMSPASVITHARMHVLVPIT